MRETDDELVHKPERRFSVSVHQGGAYEGVVSRSIESPAVHDGGLTKGQLYRSRENVVCFLRPHGGVPRTGQTYALILLSGCLDLLLVVGEILRTNGVISKMWCNIGFGLLVSRSNCRCSQLEPCNERGPIILF